MKSPCTVDVFRAESSKTVVTKVILPSRDGDIIDAIEYARNNKLRVSVVGGGHSTICTKHLGIVIDLRTKEYQNVSLIAQTEGSPLVEVGGGAALQSIANTLKDSGYSLPIGTYPSVGAGLLLQGGIGYLTREYGLSIDHLRSFDGIDGNGKILRNITKESDSDLFFAMQGAGNQVGVVVTKFVFQTVQEELVYFDRALVSRSLSEMPKFLANVIEVAINLPRTASLTFFITKAPEMTKDLVIQFFYCCKPSGETALLDTSFDIDNDETLWRTNGVLSYADTTGELWPLYHFRSVVTHLTCESFYIGLMDLPPGAATDEDFGGAPPFAAIHSFFIGGADFKSKIGAMAKKIVERAFNSLHPNFRIDFQHTGGAIKDIRPCETAFYHRDQEYSVVVCCLYRQDEASSDGERTAYAWVDSAVSAFDESGVVVGTYSVDIMVGKRAEGYLKHAYKDNWSKVLQVRDTCDPDCIFNPHDV